MIVFIPATDYHRNAHEAETMTDFDLGAIRIGTRAAFSFRIGNTGSAAVAWSLSVVDNSDPEYPAKWELPEGGMLAPGQTTDTLTVRMNLPIDAIEMGHIVDLLASDGTGNYPLELTYEAMGTNSWRRSNYPRRAGNATDSATTVIDSIGDILRVLCFHPIAWNPDAVAGYGQKMKFEVLGVQRDNLAGYRPVRIVNGSDPCDRLNPIDETFGYTQALAIIQGQFSREQRETCYSNLTATDTVMEYQVGASLAFIGQDELIRHWALFEEATETEPAQFKRSVFVLQRLGEWWSIENIRVIDKSDELSHFEADLVALHPRSMGKPTYWNPFAITYELESDVPYAAFTCKLEFPKDEFEGIPSGSAVYLGS